MFELPNEMNPAVYAAAVEQARREQLAFHPGLVRWWYRTLLREDADALGSVFDYPMRRGVLKALAEFVQANPDTFALSERAQSISLDRRDAVTVVLLEWPHGFAEFFERAGTGGCTAARYVPNDAASTQALLAFMKSQRRRTPRSSTRDVGVLTMHRGQYEQEMVAVTGKGKLVAGNYSPRVVEQYAQLRRFSQGKIKRDAGALVVVDGPPGTGKTNLLRALVRETRANFLLADNSMLANMENPAFLRFLLSEANETGDLVLLLEDADAALASRAGSDLPPLLSTLLNATSGILGDALRLRIIATVNTWQNDRVDPAASRAGRLFDRISVGLLDADQARTVVLRESGGSEVAAARVTGPMALADCYALARGR